MGQNGACNGQHNHDSRTSTIVAFVQFPLLVNRDPHETSLFQDVPQGANGTLQKRRVGDIGNQAFGLDELTSLNDFFMTLGRQGTVIPSSELKSSMTFKCETLDLRTQKGARRNDRPQVTIRPSTGPLLASKATSPTSQSIDTICAVAQKFHVAPVTPHNTIRTLFSRFQVDSP